MTYLKLLEHVYLNGKAISPRGEETREVMNCDLEITSKSPTIYAWPAFRSIEHILKYAWKEWAWYFSGCTDSKRIAESAKLWGDIKNPDGSLNSNYGYLVFYSKTPHPSMGRITMTPFGWAVHSLERNRDSRQAVVTYNSGGYNFDGVRDYICSQHQAFYIRDNKLDCYVALRSSDLIWGLSYNQPWWKIVSDQLLLTLQESKYPHLKPGTIRVKIYSAHIYKRHYELVEKMLKNDGLDAEKYKVITKGIIPLGESFGWYEENLGRFLEIHKILEGARTEHA